MRLLFALLLLTVELNCSEAAPVMVRRMRYINVTAQNNPQHISSVRAFVERGTMNFEMNLIKPFVPGLRAFIEIKLKLKNAKQFQTLFSYEMDICKMLNELSQETILKKWFQNMLKYSNFMENCPVTPDLYYVRNMTLEGASIPVYLRPGQYTFGARMYYGKRKSKREVFVLELLPELQIY